MKIAFPFSAVVMCGLLCCLPAPVAAQETPEGTRIKFLDDLFHPFAPSSGRNPYEERIETDRHILGLFTLDMWRETLTGVGFSIRESKYAEAGKEYVTFACLKPT